MTAATWKRAAKRWRARARRGNAQHEHYIVCADAERRQLAARAEAAEACAEQLHISLLAATARAEAAEAALAAVPDYASYYVTGVQLSRISGETPMTFAAWLADAQQPEAQP